MYKPFPELIFGNYAKILINVLTLKMRHYPRIYFLVSATGWEWSCRHSNKKVFKIGQNLHDLSTFPALVECRFVRGLGRRGC